LRLILPALCLLSTYAWSDPAVWQVTDSQGGELWLLGSIHYLRDQDYPLPTSIDRLYARADALVMEIDLDDLNPLAVQSAFLDAGALPASSSLRSVLAPAVYERLEAQAGALGMELALMEQFEPWLVALTFMDLGMNALGFRADQGIEQYLLRRARQDAKEIVGLETLDDQIRIFDELTRDDQEALLIQTLEELGSPGSVMDELLDAWQEGRLDTLARELSAGFEGFPKLYRALVIQRNQVWAERLRHLLREQRRLLVVVGALHLVGPQSLLEFLANGGHIVTPMATP